MSEQEEKDKEEIKYKKFPGKISEKLNPQNDEITYKKFQGGSGDVNQNNGKIIYKKFQGGSSNISPIQSTRKSQEFQPTNRYNQNGIIPNSIAPKSLHQDKKNRIINTGKRTTHYSHDSQHIDKGKFPVYQKLKRITSSDEDYTIEINTSGNDIKENEKSYPYEESEGLFNEDVEGNVNEVRNFLTNVAETKDRRHYFINIKGIGGIRKNISLYFFEILKERDVTTEKLVLELKDNILKNKNLSNQLNEKEINTLLEMITQYEDIFDEYFSHLVEVVKYLIIFSNIYKEIGAHLKIKIITDFLEELGINLLLKSQSFRHSVTDIVNFLEKSKYSKFFPIRQIKKEKLSQKESNKRDIIYRTVIGSRLKLYLMKNIYNGKYLQSGEAYCPECRREGFIINTKDLRLRAKTFHHESDKKEEEFNERQLYRMFVKNQSNPYFLEELIEKAENEKIVLLCRNHHIIIHTNNYFNSFINWEEIFNYPALFIHILIKTVIDNFCLTKELSPKIKSNIKDNIVRKLKKRYIIEWFHGGYCPICREISTKKHLSALSFAHLEEKTKKQEPYELYFSHSCLEIAQILEREKGCYVCSNCHSVFHYNKYLIDLADKIFKDKNAEKKIRDDYNNVLSKFEENLINGIDSIGEPLKNPLLTFDSTERYLTAIYEISKMKMQDGVTTSELMTYLKLSSTSSVLQFFRNSKNEVINQSVIKKNENVQIVVNSKQKGTYKKKKIISKFYLTDKGKEFVFWIYHFRDYYLLFSQYLTAIYEISESKNKFIMSDLVDYLGFPPLTVKIFFNKESDVIRQLIDLEFGNSNGYFRNEGKEFKSFKKLYKKNNNK